MYRRTRFYHVAWTVPNLGVFGDSRISITSNHGKLTRKVISVMRQWISNVSGYSVDTIIILNIIPLEE